MPLYDAYAVYSDPILTALSVGFEDRNRRPFVQITAPCPPQISHFISSLSVSRINTESEKTVRSGHAIYHALSGR